MITETAEILARMKAKTPRPHHSFDEEGFPCLEWWNGERKITIYACDSGRLIYLKVWGPNMETEMELEDLHSYEQFCDLWEWLGHVSDADLVVNMGASS